MTPAAVMLLLPICVGDAGEWLRTERIERFGAAVEASAPDDLEAQAALITIAWHESRLCRDVMRGARRGGSAVGPFQIEPASHRQPPFAGLDVEPLAHAAGEAAWLWRHSWRCGPSWAARMTAYAGAPCGSWRQEASRRARFMGWVLWELQQPY